MEYTASELMTVNASRLLSNGETVLVGVGLPNLACNLAQRTHAPGLIMIYEAGVVGSRPSRLPLSIGDPTLVSGAALVCSMYDLFSLYLQRGNVDVGFLGGAQIDRYGNINATVIGEYHHPKTRLPGSGGSMEIAGWAKRFYVITPHQKRRFPEKVDFCTSAGFLNGGNQRAESGVIGKGPQAVVTDMGLLTPDQNGELILSALHPGITVEKVIANTGWQLKVSEHLTVTAPPSETELHILRELDPQKIYL
ncbi:MAG: CoA-transferase subunit beta [Anaerolineae bacterium]|nr:CoA-transferase subunit beta [Anaerolineae bacterium]